MCGLLQSADLALLVEDEVGGEGLPGDQQAAQRHEAGDLQITRAGAPPETRARWFITLPVYSL